MSRISVNVNTRNRHNVLPMMLGSLLSQTFTDYDIIICDASDLPITEHEVCNKMLELIENNGHDVTVLRDNKIGIPQSYQVMMEHSDCNLQLRTEDDLWMEPDCLEQLHAAFCKANDKHLGAVAPMTPQWCHHPHMIDHREHNCDQWPAPGEFANGLRRVVVKDIPSLRYIWEADDQQRCWMPKGPTYEVCVIHAGALYSKAALQAAGGFSAHFSPVGHREESHVWLRVYLAGYKLLVTTKARVWHLEVWTGGSRDKETALDSDGRRACQIQDEVVFCKDVNDWMAKWPGRIKVLK